MDGSGGARIAAAAQAAIHAGAAHRTSAFRDAMAKARIARRAGRASADTGVDSGMNPPGIDSHALAAIIVSMRAIRTA